MSLSTLIEAAKYLDYLDSNNHQQQQQHSQQQLHFQPNLTSAPQVTSKRSNRSHRSSKKDAANTMLAMSLPASTRPMQAQGMPIPMMSHDSGHQATSLSSSFTTGSPLSSFASTALLCSKTSGVTSASSSAASSLSSSESSSSCGEILMGDNDFNNTPSSSVVVRGGNSTSGRNLHKRNNNYSNTNHHNYHLTHQKFETNHPCAGNQQSSLTSHQFTCGSGDQNQSIARYIAATSAGPQLVTMTNNSTMASSAPVDGNIRVGHVIQAANTGALLSAAGTSFDSRHYSISTGSHQRAPLQALGLAASSFDSDNQSGGSASSCPPLIMARVQPMILNTMSPSAQGMMAFQPATASSPTSSSSSYSRHRELHKTLEKNRRAHLRHCFELLKAELPASECVDKKTSHINIIKSAIRYVLALRQQECEIDSELQRLTQIKSELTENLTRIRLGQQSHQTIDQEHQTPLAAMPTQQTSTSTSSYSVSTSAAAVAESPASPMATSETQKQDQLQQHQQPVAEQQLSFLLSQSKID